MLDGASKAFFHLLAQSHSLKTLASRYGMRGSRSFARRFIAGETTAEAIEAARTVEGRGLLHTLDHLGESVGSLADADAATREYREICETDRRRRHRPEHLAQAHAARPRRGSRERRGQPAEDSRPHGSGGVLRAHRHGELGVYAGDARHLRNPVGPGAPADRRRAAGRAAPDGAGSGAHPGARGTRAARQGRLQGTKECRVPAQAGRGRGVRAADEDDARTRRLSGVRHARPGDARAREAMGGRARHRASTVTNSSCCTASAAICRPRSSRRATACASTSRSDASGFRTSCAASASGRPTSRRSCAASGTRRRLIARRTVTYAATEAQRAQRHYPESRPPCSPCLCGYVVVVSRSG